MLVIQAETRWNSLPQLSVLVCAADAAAREGVRAPLAAQGFMVTTANSINEAVNAVRRQSVDLAVLDIQGAAEACWRIRAFSPRTGIVTVNAYGDPDDHIRTLEAGADDCVAKPFGNRELIARLRAVQRRLGVAGTTRPAHLENGELRLDLVRRSAWKAGREISLSPKEFGLLETLMKNAGIPVAREDLLRAAWGAQSGEAQDLRTYVRRLRRKLEDGDGPRFIFTEPWVGYRFRSPSKGSPRDSDADRLRYRLPRHDHAMLNQLRVDQVRRAVRANEVTFPHPVPTFHRHDRPDLQWKLALLYFVRGWSCEDLAERYQILDQRVRQILKTWTKRAIEMGYVQSIPPAEGPRAAKAGRAGRKFIGELPGLPHPDLLPAEIPASYPPA